MKNVTIFLVGGVCIIGLDSIADAIKFISENKTIERMVISIVEFSNYNISSMRKEYDEPSYSGEGKS
jgi:hypothetical protein